MRLSTEDEDTSEEKQRRQQQTEDSHHHTAERERLEGAQGVAVLQETKLTEKATASTGNGFNISLSERKVRRGGAAQQRGLAILARNGLPCKRLEDPKSPSGSAIEAMGVRSSSSSKHGMCGTFVGRQPERDRTKEMKLYTSRAGQRGHDKVLILGDINAHGIWDTDTEKNGIQITLEKN